MTALGSTIVPVANSDTHRHFEFGPERSIFGTIKCELTPLQEERIRLIDEENYNGVRRKVVEELRKTGQEPDPAWIEEGILALKQYYAVALLDPRNFHAVSDLIDPFWHAHILHTRQYADFCERTFGEFVHHEPLDHELSRIVGKVEQFYAYTHGIYDGIFSYYSEEFYPQEVPECRLICYHYSIRSGVLAKESSFPRIPAMRLDPALPAAA